MDFSKQQEKFLNAFKTDILQGIRQDIKDEGRSTRDFARQEIQASEHRLRAEFKQDIQTSEKRIIEAVGQMVDGNVLPQVDDHEQRLVVLET